MGEPAGNPAGGDFGTAGPFGHGIYAEKNGNVSDHWTLFNANGFGFSIAYDSQYAETEDNASLGYGHHLRAPYRNGSLGPGWYDNHQAYMVRDADSDYYLVIRNGRRSVYRPINAYGRGEGVGPQNSWITRPGVDDSILHLNYASGWITVMEQIDDAAKFPFFLRKLDSDGPWWRVQKRISPSGREMTYTYDDSATNLNLRGLLTQITDGYGRTITLTHEENWYGAVNGYRVRLRQVTDPAGKVWQFNYGPNADYYQTTMLLSVTDPEGHARSYEYGGLNWMAREVLRNGTAYHIAYQLTGQGYVAIQEVDANGVPGADILKVEVEHFWPKLEVVETTHCESEPIAVPPEHRCEPQNPYIRRVPHWTMRIVEWDGEARLHDGNGDVWVYTLDDQGRISTITAPADSGDPTNRTTSYTYDDYAGSFSANGHTLAGSGTRRTRSITTAQGTSYYDYDRDSLRPRRKVDPLGNLTTYEHGDSNRPALVTRKIEPDGDTWDYTYNSNGDTTQEDLTANGGQAPSRTITHAPTYYADGKRLQQRVTTDIRGDTTTQTYNSNGTLDTVVQDAEVYGVTTTYTHDVMGRVNSRTEVRDSGVDVKTEFFYDDAGWLTRSVVNSNGLALTTSYERDGEGRLTAITDPRGTITRYVFDHRDRLAQEIVDSNGLNLVTSNGYDNADNLTRIVDPRGQATSIAYFTYNLGKVITDAEGYETRLQWDALGNLAELRRGRTPANEEFYATRLVYDGLSRLTDVIVDSNGLALHTQYAYASAGGGGCGCSGTPGKALVSQITDPAGKKTYYQYDDLDRLKRIIREVGGATGQNGEPDADDVVTQVDYDDTGHTVEVVNPESEIVRYGLDTVGRLLYRRVNPDGANLWTWWAYDGNGPVNAVGFPNGNTAGYSFDAAGRRMTADDDVGHIADYTYDAAGNVRTITDGENNVTSNGYDRAGRLTSVLDANDHRETYQYDANGNRTYVTDRNGRTTHYEYDDINQLTKVTEDNSTGGLKRITEYTYDGRGNVLTLKAYSGTDSSGNLETTTYGYDTAGRLTQVTYPDNVNGNGMAWFTWYPAGTVHTRTDQKDVVTTYTYDDLHRLTDRVYDDGLTGPDHFAYDKVGRLTVGSNGLARLAFDYDDAGRLTGSTETLNGVGYATGVQYDVLAGTRTLTYPDDTTPVVETYDARERLDSIYYGARALVAGSAHDAADRLTGRTLGNGVVSSYQYDPNGWLTQVQHVRGVLTLEKLAYGYDPVGNVQYRQVQTPGLGGWPTSAEVGDSKMSELYSYDTLHRLSQFERGVLNEEHTSVTEPAPAPYVQSQSWGQNNGSLDVLGNWLTTVTWAAGSSSTDTRTINGANEYTYRRLDGGAWVSLTSDHNGNLTDDPTARNVGDTGSATGQRYEYDAENRLVRVWHRHGTTTTGDDTILQEDAYDALGRRVVTRDVPGQTGAKQTTHVYGGGPETLVEYDSTAAEGDARERWFVHGTDFPDPLVMVDRTAVGAKPAGEDEYLYYLKDMLGSVTALADSNGVVVERYVYDPYGAPTLVLGAYAWFEFWHDADWDGNIDAADEADFDACFGSGSAPCVFLHDRNGNNVVDVQDAGMFADCATNGAGHAPPERCRRPASGYFDVNGDGVVALYDFGGLQDGFGTDPSTWWFRLLYDLDGDGAVDLDDHAAFLANIGGPGLWWPPPDPAPPTPATASRYGNPFRWTGQRYDAPVGLYHFVYRSYSPVLGRWLQRDPLGYVDGASLYQYVVSSPLAAIDPFGNELKVDPKDKDLQKEVEDALKELVPSAKVDDDTGEVTWDKTKEPVKPGTPGDILKWWQHGTHDIEREKPQSNRGGGPHDDTQQDKTIIPKDIPPAWDEDCKPMDLKPWDVLWHELIHAARKKAGLTFTDDRGKIIHYKEEYYTIEAMNKLYDWYNRDKPEAKKHPRRHPLDSGYIGENEAKNLGKLDDWKKLDAARKKLEKDHKP